ncbi:lipase family protein [Pleurocapsales cyanobacterium LEGE 10410]|nr:lipase family protein [Pleurocapsales cyanobacterium LEGE 10410]
MTSTIQDITKLPFNFDTTLYQPENSYWMAIFSNLVYLTIGDRTGEKDFTPDEDTILSKLKALDSEFLAVEGFSFKSSQGIVIQHKNYVVAVFRGTDELVDWLDNVKAFPIKGPLGNVHSGFYNALLDIWVRQGMWDSIQQLRERGSEFDDSELPVWLRGLKKPKRSLWLTGHSLGGAMATLAAAWLAERKIPFSGAYTFGQPRVGDENFQVAFDTKLNKRFFRFQNNNDIVTRVPARLMGYEHVGRYIHITEKRELKADVSWWHLFVDRLEGVVKNILDNQIRLEIIDDHHLEKQYLEGIKAWGNRLPDKWERFSEEM